MSCPDGFWCFQAKDILNAFILLATIYAIYIGPIRAVEVARSHEEHRETRRRRYEIFHNLMKTRRSNLSAEHVTSLNLIQVEFYGEPEIVNAYKKYMTLLLRKVPDIDTSQDVIDRFFEEQHDAFFELVHEIGKPLGFVLDKHDLQRYSYAPQGWGNADTQIAALRALMIELLSGRRSLPVTSSSVHDLNSKYPPPPSN